MTTLVLGAGGVSALAQQRARLTELRARGLWPAQVPAVVLVECLTGDHRRDHAVSRLLAACQVRDVDEERSRQAALLRTRSGRAGTISATDAVVAAMCLARSPALVLTPDPDDLRALLAGSPAVAVAAV